MRGGRIAAPLYPTKALEICAKHPRKTEKQLGFLAITLYGMRHSRHGMGWARRGGRALGASPGVLGDPSC